MKFKIGDVVQHNAGGQRLTIGFARTVDGDRAYQAPGVHYRCEWFDMYGKASFREYHEDMLRLVELEAG